MTPPTLHDVGLQSSHKLERIDAVEHPQAADGARVDGGVNSSRIAA